MTTVYKACSLEDFRYICNTKRFYITPHAFTYNICQDDRIDSSTTCAWFVLQSETCMSEDYSMLISVRELAKRIKKDKSTAARALKTLEKYGYIEVTKVPIPGIGVLCTKVHLRFPEEAVAIIKTHKDRRAPGSINALGRQTPPSNIAYRSNSFSETPVQIETHTQAEPQVTVEPKTVMDIKPVAPVASAASVVAKSEPVCATPKTGLHFAFPEIGRSLTPGIMVDLDHTLTEPSAVVPRVSVAPSVDLGKNLSAQPVDNFRMESAVSPEMDEPVQQVIYSASVSAAASTAGRMGNNMGSPENQLITRLRIINRSFLESVDRATVLDAQGLLLITSTISPVSCSLIGPLQLHLN